MKYGTCTSTSTGKLRHIRCFYNLFRFPRYFITVIKIRDCHWEPDYSSSTVL